MTAATVAGLIIELGLQGALIFLKNASKIATIDDAIVALEMVKSAQQYVDEDAARCNVPSVPLIT